MLQTLWFRARSELQFASVHPSTDYCTPTANWLNSCLLPEDALYQWDPMRCIFLTKFQVLSQAFWIWALYAMQVVEAVRHALCESESEVNELRKASEHCQEVREPGSSRAHGPPIVPHRVPSCSMLARMQKVWNPKRKGCEIRGRRSWTATHSCYCVRTSRYSSIFNRRQGSERKVAAIVHFDNV